MKNIPIQHEGDSYQAAEVHEHKIVLVKIAWGNHEYFEIEKLPSGSVVFRIINVEQQDVHHPDWEEHEGALPLTYDYPETARMTMEVVGKSAKVLTDWMVGQHFEREIRGCQECGELFPMVRKDQRFHSRECKNRWHQRKSRYMEKVRRDWDGKGCQT